MNAFATLAVWGSVVALAMLAVPLVSFGYHHRRLRKQRAELLRSAYWRREFHRGMTLVELLIVVTVMVVLIGVALPTVRYALEGRRVRESARALNTYFSVAKAHAATSRRPAGVWMDVETLPEDPSIAFVRRVHTAQTPPPYGGDVVGAKMISNVQPQPVGYMRAWYDSGAASIAALVQVGDRVKFDYKGPLYEVTAIGATASAPPAVPSYVTGELRFILVEASDPKPPESVPGDFIWLPFQFTRQPVKTSTKPLDLPSGAVIDLAASGIGLTGTELAGTLNPLVIMFTPSGRIDRIIGLGANDVPRSAVHLLLGDIGQLGAGPSLPFTASQNASDPSSLWVSIGNQTGSVTTAENAWETKPTLAESLRSAREFAQQAQGVGGR